MTKLVRSFREQRFQRGNDGDKVGKVLSLKIGGEAVFLGGHPFTIAGKRLNGIVAEGCSQGSEKITKLLCYFCFELEYE